MNKIHVPFKEAIEDITGGNAKLQTSEYGLVGSFPIIDQGQAFIAGYTDDKNSLCKRCGDVIIFGDHTRVFKFIDFDFVLGADGVKVLRPNFGFDARYLFYYLQTVKLPENLGYSRNFKYLKECLVPKPPLEEQKRIAAILDKADSLRRKRQQAIRLADDFLRAVFLDMFGEPVTNPKGWPVGTIRDLVASANYGTSEKANETEGQYSILRMNNLTYEGRLDLSSLKYVDLDEKVADKYLARKGDLLFNRTNSKELVGKTAVYDRNEMMAIAGYLVRVRMNGKGNPHYVSAYLNSAHGKATLQAMCKSIVGMANINAQEMQNIRIMLPPIDLQDRYGNVVEKMRATEQTFSQSSEVCGKLFAALTSDLLG